MASFSQTLLNWYLENQRSLPWRNETDPYKIWVSEIILQQTRVNQGWNYYLSFIKHFPTIQDLAEAPEEKVLKVWQGLGYYSRARYMHETAVHVIKFSQGLFPNKYEEIRKLKGVGDYTAAAIASIAFSLPYPAVDGNVLRVICRYFGIFENIALPATIQLVREKCAQLMKNYPPGDFNQAMMEFGAVQCLPKNPDCDHCPFHSSCHAYNQNQIETLPIKIKKINIRPRYFHYLFFSDQQKKTIIQQRRENDIWKNLFEFPLVETKEPDFSIDNYLTEKNIHNLVPPQLFNKVRHRLTHQLINVSFYTISVSSVNNILPNSCIVPLTDLSKYPMPKVMFDLILSYKL